jgi:hypothetical protein
MNITSGTIVGNPTVQYLGCYFRGSTAEQPAQALPIVRLRFADGTTSEGRVELYPEPRFVPVAAGSADEQWMLDDRYTWHATDCPCFACHSASIGDVHTYWRRVHQWSQLRTLARRTARTGGR